jgi:hypothetical protein
MPKVYNTRRQRAEQLLDRLRRGPSLSPHRMGASSCREAEAQVKNWLSAWIVDEVIDLVPELRQRNRKAKHE